MVSVSASQARRERIMTDTRMARRQFLVCAGVLITSPFGRPAFAQAKAGIRSNIANAAGATNLTLLQLMKQQKFLEEFGIDPNVVNVADGSKIVSALLGGDMDISTMSGFGQERAHDLGAIRDVDDVRIDPEFLEELLLLHELQQGQVGRAGGIGDVRPYAGLGLGKGGAAEWAGDQHACANKELP